MEYFTRQITLQERLKQHECQLYPLIGSCLELRDDSPEGCYQDSPMDLSQGGLTSTDMSSSLGNSEAPHTDKSSRQGDNEPPHMGKSFSQENKEPSHMVKSFSQENKEPSHMGKAFSPGNVELSHMGKSFSPGNNEPSHMGKSSSPGNIEPSYMGKFFSPGHNELSHMGKSSSPGNIELSHMGKSSSPGNIELSHMGKSSSPGNIEPSHMGQSSSPGNNEPPHMGKSLSPGNKESSHMGKSLSPGNNESSHMGKSLSPGNNESSHMSKSSSPRFRTSIGTNNFLPSGNQDLLLASYTTVSINNEERSSCANEQPERHTTQLSVHQNKITDVTNPLLKQVLESQEPTVSGLFTMRDMQDQTEMLHQAKQIHETDSSLQSDHEVKQLSSSTTNSDRDSVFKERHSSVDDDQQSKHSDGPKHNSETTNGKEHKLLRNTTTDNRESERTDSITHNKIQNSANGNVKGLTSTTETIRKYGNSRKRGRFFSTGVKQAYLPIGKKLCDSQVCPNVSVTDFTHEGLSDKNRRISENAKYYRKIWPRTDINMLLPEKRDPVFSIRPHSNHLVMLVPSSVSLIGNTSSVEQTVERPPVVDISTKQRMPPPLLLTSGQSELNQNIHYPCSQSNIIPQHYLQHQQKQQMQHGIQTNSTAISNNNPVRMTTPLDLSTKAMHSQKQSSHAYNSVSEETRIKEISDSLRAQLLCQSTTVPHSCPGVCLGHAVKGKGTPAFMSSAQHKSGFQNKTIDQTSIIIERQVLLNLDYKHLLNSDSETSSNVNTERLPSEALTTDNDKLPTQDGQELLHVKQHRTQIVDPKTTSQIDHKRLPDVDQVTVQAVDPQRSTEVNHIMSTDTDSKVLPRNEQSPSVVAKEREQLAAASGSTNKDTDGPNVRTSHSMAWNMSVSKTIGLHSNCNNCKACRRIFAKLSIPPIEEQQASSKQPDLG